MTIFFPYFTISLNVRVKSVTFANTDSVLLILKSSYQHQNANENRGKNTNPSIVHCCYSMSILQPPTSARSTATGGLGLWTILIKLSPKLNHATTRHVFLCACLPFWGPVCGSCRCFYAFISLNGQTFSKAKLKQEQQKSSEAKSPSKGRNGRKHKSVARKVQLKLLPALDSGRSGFCDSLCVCVCVFLCVRFCFPSVMNK